MSKKKEEVINEPKTKKESYKHPVVFCSISDKQILSTFESKTKKDIDGHPFKLSRILLPGDKFSKSPLGDGATIVVPSFTILDDKFNRDSRKVLSIDPKREYEIHLKGELKKDGTYDNRVIKVCGERLKDAFSPKEKDKEKIKEVSR